MLHDAEYADLLSNWWATWAAPTCWGHGPYSSNTFFVRFSSSKVKAGSGPEKTDSHMQEPHSRSFDVLGFFQKSRTLLECQHQQGRVTNYWT